MTSPTHRDPLEYLNLESLSRLSAGLQQLIRSRLWLKVLLGMVLGVGLGLLLAPSTGLVRREVSQPLVAWFAMPGRLFLALIQMIVTPLVFASVVRGLTASESLEQLKRDGTRAIVFFGTTTAAATALGIGVAYAVRPGAFIDPEKLTQPGQVPTGTEAAQLPKLSELPDAIFNVIPDNPLASMVGGEMLQVILFAAIVGVALLAMPGQRSLPLYELLGSLQEVCMTVVGWAMKLAPLAVFGLMARLTATVGLETLAGMGVYVATVMLGLSVLAVLYLGLVSALGKRSPWRFLKATREVLLLAFSTSSSAAVMPVSIETAQRSLGVRESTARFVVPLGATINMTGTALYQGVAAVFLAQAFGVRLGPTELVLIVVTAVAASIGSPATPGVGIVILAMVLKSAGIPAVGAVLLIGVDRILDMTRTAVNVLGDLVACVVLDREVTKKPVRVDPQPKEGGQSWQTLQRTS